MQPISPVPPRQTDSSQTVKWAIGCVAIVALAGCGAGFWVLRKASDAVTAFGDSFSEQIRLLDAGPSVEKMPLWNKDQLTVKLTFRSKDKEYKDVKITSLLLDGYLPEKKTPISVPSFSDKKPAAVTVAFPGFDGRGGKISKLQLTYEWTGKHVEGSMKISDGDRTVEASGDTWTCTEKPDVNVPLRDASPETK